MHITLVSLKSYLFHNFLSRSNSFVCFIFFKNPLHQKMLMWYLCLRHGAYFNGTSNVFVSLLIIFLGHDWFRFFLNKWGFIPCWHISQRLHLVLKKISRAYTISSVESTKKFRNLPITTSWRYECKYVWICKLAGSCGVKPQSYIQL